jgi:hypothetical protein
VPVPDTGVIAPLITLGCLMLLVVLILVWLCVGKGMPLWPFSTGAPAEAPSYASFQQARHELVHGRAPQLSDSFWLDVVGIPIELWMRACPYGAPMDHAFFASLIRRRDEFGDFTTPVELRKRITPAPVKHRYFSLPVGAVAIGQGAYAEARPSIENLLACMSVPPPLVSNRTACKYFEAWPHNDLCVACGNEYRDHQQPILVRADPTIMRKRF